MAERNEKKKMAVVLLVLFLESLQVTALDDSAYNLRKCFVGVNNYILGQEYSRLCFELLSENPRDSRVVVLMDSSSTGTGKNTMFWGMRETLDEKIRETGWGYEIKVQAVSIDSSNAFMTEETIRKLMYKIMLADDEGIVIDSLTYIIRQNFNGEYQVESAKTGRSVIELAESFRPDIAFMDIQMPGINGIEAMKEIKKNNPNLIFIVMSAYGGCKCVRLKEGIFP